MKRLKISKILSSYLTVVLIGISINCFSQNQIERRFVYRDGEAWQVCEDNNITIAQTLKVKRDYGKWNVIDIVISNNSSNPIEVDPYVDISAFTIDKKEKPIILKVWSFEDYIKKVKRSQTWASIVIGFSEGMSTANAGYSTSTTSGYAGNYHYTSYTTTYNAGAAAQARMQSQQRMNNFSIAQSNDIYVKQIGYLKRNTIEPGESVSGFFHIEYTKGISTYVTIKINDIEYTYCWENSN